MSSFFKEESRSASKTKGRCCWVEGKKQKRQQKKKGVANPTMQRRRTELSRAAKDFLPPLYSTSARGKIRRIEGNAKCRHLNKLTCTGTLRHVFTVYLYEAQKNPIPLLTHCNISVNSILIHTGKGGGGRVEPERR